MSNITVWLNVANVLYLVSYSVRDILWLRILTVAAAMLLIPYYMLQPEPLMAAIAWNVLFIAINLYWIVRLLIERRPVHFSPDEARLKLLSFPSLTPREARNLFDTGVWNDLSAGTSIVEHDTRTNRFSVILRGIASVVHAGTMIAKLGEGQFVGVIDKNAEQLDIDVVVREGVRVMCWASGDLDSFLADRPDVDLALQRSVGLEVQRLFDSSLSKIDQRGSPSV